MIAALVGISIGAVIAVAFTYLFASDKGYDDGHADGFAKGYVAGQLYERQALGRIINAEQQRGLAAQRNIDYLYQRTVRELSDSPWPPNGDYRDERAAGS